jgi:fatty acid desaturase
VRAYPIPARANLAIAVGLVAAVVGIFGLAAELPLAVCALVLAPAHGVVMNAVYSLIHEAEHDLFHPDPRVNAGAGIALALLFPAPFHLLRQGHLGHHLRNRSDDEAFDLYFPEDRALWKRLQFYGILLGLYWAVVALGNAVALLAPRLLRAGAVRFDRPTAALLASLNPRYELLVRLEAAAAIAAQVGLVGLLGVPLLHWLVVSYGFGLTWSGLQYVHHFDTVRDVRWGARNLATWRWLDALWLNHNWHLNHHLHPAVPWRHLPSLPAAGAGPRGSLGRAWLAMWRGPRLTRERVENRHGGLVIR